MAVKIKSFCRLRFFMKRQFLLFAALLALTLSFGIFNQISACTCAKQTPCRAYYSADLVFIGKVIGSKTKSREATIVNGKSKERATRLLGKVYDFEVLEIFGTSKKLSRVKISSKFTSCDVHFSEGETYLVFAHKISKGEYTTSRCSGTYELFEQDEYLIFLRESLPKYSREICDFNGLNYNYPQQDFFSLVFR